MGHKGGCSFKAADGRGLIQVKCEAGRHGLENIPLTFFLSAGSGRAPDALQLPRGPVQHDFAHSGVRGLSKDEEIWDFSACQDKQTPTFSVCLAVMSPWQCQR